MQVYGEQDLFSNSIVSAMLASSQLSPAGESCSSLCFSSRSSSFPDPLIARLVLELANVRDRMSGMSEGTSRLLVASRMSLPGPTWALACSGHPYLDVNLSLFSDILDRTSCCWTSWWRHDGTDITTSACPLYYHASPGYTSTQAWLRYPAQPLRTTAGNHP